MSEAFKLGEKAAQDGRTALDCPFPTGSDRTQWLAGFFSVKVPVRRKGVRVAKERRIR